MKCLKCGSTYNEAHKFCPQCGTAITRGLGEETTHQKLDHKLVEEVEKKLMDKSNEKKEVLGPDESRTAEQIAREVEAIKPLELAINPGNLKKVAKKLVKGECHQEEEVDEDAWLQELLESNQFSLHGLISVITKHLKDPVATGRALREKVNYKGLYAALAAHILINALIGFVLIRVIFKRVLHTLDSVFYLWLHANVEIAIPYLTREIGWHFFVFNIVLDLAIVLIFILALTLSYKYFFKMEINWRKIPECFWLDFEILALTKIITLVVLFISPVVALMVYAIGFFTANTLTIIQVAEALKEEPRSFYFIPILYIFISVMTIYGVWRFLC